MARVSTSATCAAYTDFQITATFDAWESGTSVSGNYSTVSWHLVVACTNSGYTFSGSTRNHAGWVSCGIDGNQVFGGYTGMPHGMTNGTVLVDRSGSINIGHNNDGTKSVSFFVDLDQSDDDYGRIDWYFYDGPRSTGTLGLSTIARASQPLINTWPSNSPDITAGTACTIHMNQASDSFTHTVSWSFGSLSNQTSGLARTSGIKYNVSWTPPISMMNQIPNATSGSGTVSVTTYNGSTAIGTKTVPFTLHQPSDSAPGESASYAEAGTLADGKTTLSSKGIGATTVVGQVSVKKITISASAKYGSSIKQITCTHNGQTQVSSSASATFTFNAPVNTGSNKSYFSWTVKDSRGNTSQDSIAMDFIPYQKPVIGVLNPVRANATVSTGTVSINGSFYNGSVGNISNGISASITYNGTTVSPTLTKSGNTFSGSSNISGVNPSGNYSFTATVTDSLGFSNSRTVTLPKASPTLWAGNKTVKVNDYLIVNSDMKVAGKTLKRYMLDFFYPVGAIYTSTSSTSPVTLFGGTWEEITGRFLLAHDSSHPAASTGGEYQHILTVDEMPSHRHSSDDYVYGYPTPSAREGRDTECSWVNNGQPDSNNPSTGENGPIRTSYVGGGKAHNNTPPYLSVYMWKRTA